MPRTTGLTPGAALSRLSDHTRTLLNQDRAGGNSNDGMDAAMCRMDATTGELVFAGARLSLLIAGTEGVQRIRGDRISLGYPDTPAGPRFEEHTLRPEDGATVVIATDGLTDQPGGRRGRAFGYGRAIAALTSGGTDAAARLAALSQAFEAHVGTGERRDDLTVLAFRPRRDGG